MRRILAAIAFALCAWPAGAAAQQASPQVQQAAIANVGAWMQQYNAVLMNSTGAMNTIDQFTSILERFSSHRLNKRAALREMEQWHSSVRAAMAPVHAAADALPPPPDLTVLGGEGGPIAASLEAAYRGLPQLIAGFDNMLDRVADLGVDFINHPHDAHDVAERAIFEAQLQLVKADADRLAVMRAVLPHEHPNYDLTIAVQSFYEAEEAIATNELAELDGHADNAALAATLTRVSNDMRAAVARSEQNAERMRQQARWAQAPGEEEMASLIVRMLESFPESYRHYRALADLVERSGTRIGAGEDVIEVWAEMDEGSQPLLESIGRLENDRALLMTQGRGAL